MLLGQLGLFRAQLPFDEIHSKCRAGLSCQQVQEKLASSGGRVGWRGGETGLTLCAPLEMMAVRCSL